MNEPRFLLDANSICYGCQYYKHWTRTDDPNFWMDKSYDMDENGGVCDVDEPCFEGDKNNYRIKL